MVKLGKDSVINIAFVGEKEMAQLNKKYRGKKGAVPVLAFPMGEKGPDGINRLGDIAICIPLARELAKEKKKNAIDIIGDLAQHGVKILIKN